MGKLAADFDCRRFQGAIETKCLLRRRTNPCIGAIPLRRRAQDRPRTLDDPHIVRRNRRFNLRVVLANHPRYCPIDNLTLWRIRSIGHPNATCKGTHSDSNADLLHSLTAYSCRSASTGCTEAARRAGIQLAAKPTATSNSAPEIKLTGSAGCNPYSIDLISCARNSAAVSPTAIPAKEIQLAS